MQLCSYVVCCLFSEHAILVWNSFSTCMRAVNRQPMFTARGTRRAFSFLCAWILAGHLKAKSRQQRMLNKRQLLITLHRLLDTWQHRTLRISKKWPLPLYLLSLSLSLSLSFSLSFSLCLLTLSIDLYFSAATVDRPVSQKTLINPLARPLVDRERPARYPSTPIDRK